MSATTQNLTVQLGVASEIDFTDAAASDNNKLMCVISSEGSVVMVKNSILKGGSADEIEIKEDEKYTVKLSIADLEKLAGKNTITYELYMWVLLPEQPYDPKIFIGSVTVNDYANVAPSTFIFNLGKSINVPSGITDLTDLNASLASFPTGMLQQGDLCTLSSLPNLYKYNGTDFEEVWSDVTKTANLGDIIIYLMGSDPPLNPTNLSYANLAGASLTSKSFIGVNFTGANLTGCTFTDSNFTGANLTDVIMGATLDTKLKFKAVVGAGNWNAVTTIWIDGNPIGE